MNPRCHNSAANTYPSSYALALCNSSGFDTSTYASLRQTLFAPPDATAYIQPQPIWVAAISVASQQPSLYNTVALLQGSTGMSRPHTLFTYGHPSTLCQSPSEVGVGCHSM